MKIVTVLLAAAALLMPISLAAGSKTEPSGGPAIGTVIPAFSLPDVNGKQINTDQFHGRILVLNFWAFWCDTWKAELPHLKELTGAQNQEGFSLVAVSVDGTRLDEYWGNRGGETPFPVLLDPGSRVSNGYNIQHVPTVVIIDTKGRVCYVHSGYPGNQAILTQVRRIQNSAGIKPPR